MRIKYFEELDSTQKYLLEKIRTNELASPICIVANKQNAGIGSRGNRWEQVQDSLAFSFALSLSSLPQDLPIQSSCIFFGFIFKEILVQMGFDVWLKWPNDLYIGDLKVGGIMANTSKSDLVCGIGLNIYAEKFGSLGASVSKQGILESFFEKIKNLPEWKQIFSKYALEFHKNFNFSFHYDDNSDNVLSLKGAKLLLDGGLYLDGEKIYNFR
ncbi:biotin--[acetyl-CoA-carboxylase] ligase [Helicobacter sp. 11S02596-1]|uniref:biotin--[acetyl-CoA-carboxylase] ligase n=1 Tax=Helicobacter sp. 11S02596-1 TaxID=1476194 RepID=UPI000BA62F30|nr:biotin--[acetyl-CoA-carboxylase] ligase [Helicobacter sp. 11S02596-1]PAF44222.1 biotin--[acetyl-CoA-carboxylase] ligase [Helicobacter sp. 11S02596-1]